MRRLLVFLSVFSSVFGIAADTELKAQKVTTPPTIDGKVTPEEWAYLPTAKGFVDESTGQPAERGEFWIGYDAKFIYFAAKVQTDPSQVKATEYRQNVSLGSDDVVYLGIDPFGTGSQVNVFGVNAKGATEINIAGGRAAKREWLGEILAGARKTDTGYEVEARIPWAIMRLPAPGVRDVRLQVGRHNARIQRTSFWAYMPNGNSDTPYWRGVDLPSSGTSRSIKLLPYVYGGFDERDHIANAGLDLKTSLNDRIDAVATINPDFRNVENQILSLDFSYFERLASESRPFFLEGADYFQTSRDTPLFASQRIQKFDVGFKTFGQITDLTNFAVLNTTDLGHRNNFVARIRQQTGPNSKLTGAVTNIADANGADNTATFLSFDAAKNGFGVFGQHMSTRDTVAGGGHRLNTGFFYEKDGWEGNLEYLEISKGFLPRLGFSPERDFRGVNGFVEFGRPIAKGPLMEWGVNLGLKDQFAFDGAQYRRGAEGGLSLTFRDGTDLDIGASFEKFRSSNDHIYYFSLERPRGDSYRHWQFDFQSGRIAGQRYDSFSAEFAYRPLERLQLSLTGQEVRHFEKSTQVIFGANYDIGKDMSISGRAVREGRDTNAYLAFRKSGSKGTEYYVIFGDPNSDTFQRALVIKAVIPFEIKF